MPLNFRKRSPAPHSTPSACDLSIIIVSWNVWDLLRACLQSIEDVSRASDDGDPALRYFGPTERQRTLEVVVVDNASTDATVEVLPTRFPWVRLLRNEDNLGFTGGNNCGYAASQGDFVFFLNPDTELVPGPDDSDSLWQLISAVCDDETVGAAGPYLRYGDGAWQNNRRRFPGRLTGFVESTWLGRSKVGRAERERFFMLDWPASYRHDVDWLVGAALLARRDALEEIRLPQYDGPFDEAFFMYSEEVDLCNRLKSAGWRLIFEPDARIVHYEGRSSEQVVAARHIRFNTSKVLYYRKHIGKRWAELLRHYLLFEFRWQMWAERIKALLGHKQEIRRARIDAYKRVLASGLRPAPD